MRFSSLTSLLPLLFFLTAPAPVWSAEMESAALITYKRFANAFIRGQLTAARRLADDQAREVIDRKEALVRAGEKIRPVMEPMFMIVEEKPDADDRKVFIHAVQVVQPQTDEGAFEPPALHRQFVTLEKRGKEWRVVSFRDDLEKCCDP